MYDKAHVNGFDIETLNDQGQGLDPTNKLSRVTQVALVTETEEFVFEGTNEATLLNAFALQLGELEPGLLGGWNSSMFDLPFLKTRAQICEAKYLDDFLKLIPQPGLIPKYNFTPGHTTGYTALIRTPKVTHTHLDISYAWKAFAESFGLDSPQGKPTVPWSLKPVCKAAGIDMFVIDRTRLHDYSDEDQRKYVLSDTIGTRELILRTLGLAPSPLREFRLK